MLGNVLLSILSCLNVLKLFSSLRACVRGEIKRQRHRSCPCDVFLMSSKVSTCFVFHQEKYKRDQEKLQAEWLKAQQDIAKNTVQQVVKDIQIYIIVKFSLVD